MKKTTRNILITISVFLGLFLIFAGFLLYKFNTELSEMNVAETGPVAEAVFAIKDEQVNMFLVKAGNNFIAIDCGKNIEVVEREFKKLKINPEAVIAVFLTHTDRDHVAALPLFEKAALYFAREEVKMLNGERQRIPFYNNKITRSDFILLEGRQSVSVGGVRINSILTEGHTSGSMCYLVNENFLFTGDILKLTSGKIAPFVKFFNLENDVALRSISKITQLAGVKYLLTSHYGVSNNYEEAVKGWAGKPD